MLSARMVISVVPEVDGEGQIFGLPIPGVRKHELVDTRLLGFKYEQSLVLALDGVEDPVRGIDDPKIYEFISPQIQYSKRL